MGIFTRMSNMLKSKVNATLDEMENPIELLDQKVRDMEAQLNTAKLNSAQIIGNAHEIKKKMDACEIEVKDYEEKVKLALANNLKPIFCIGEVLEEREANKQNEVVEAQLASVFSLSAEDFGKVILAYEPVWAIGTGKTATPEQAQEIHAHIRSLVAAKYGQEVAENTSILYGGSCKPSNAKELFANPDVDGGLIGGAALKAADFKGIIDAFK